MAKKAPNTASGSGSTHPPLYRWSSDNRGKVHTRAQKIRRPGKKAPAQNASQNDLGYLTGPSTMPQINSLADRMTNLNYGPQIRDVQTRQAEVAPWFQQYMTQLQGLQTQTSGMQQPAITQAQSAVDNQKTTPGVDPNSQAGKDDQLAAAGRAALLKLGVDSLQGIQNTGNSYFGQVQAATPLYQRSAEAGLANELASTRAQAGDYRASTLGTLQQQNRQYALDTQHQLVENKAFNVNTKNTALDNQRADKQLRSSNRNARKSRQAASNTPVTSGPFAGLTKKEITKLDPKARQGYVNAYNKGKGKGAGAKKAPSAAAQKTASQIRRGVVLVRQGDNGADGYWQDAYNRLIRDDGLDPIIARAIISGARHGTIGPKTKKSLKNQFGVTGVSIPGKPHRPKPNPTGGTVSSGAVGYPYGTGAGQVH